MDDAVSHVVIVGGGTAGWLTAGLLAADHCAASPDGLRVTLIESPKIGILGVGEGTWPSLRDTLRRIGIRETEFIRRCNASFKQGSRFDGWVDGSAGDRYFHPFEAPPNPDDIDVLALWRALGEGVPFAEAASHQAALCLAGRAPKQAGTPEYAAVANYAYHLDAPAFAELLREHCTATLGVRHIEDDVGAVRRRQDGSVEAVEAEVHGAMEADLFVDCTGSRARLIGGEMDVDVHDVSHILFNDRALALHVPYREEQEPIASQTTGTATSMGWVWDIALQTRRGVGHVFSSRHASEDEARTALAAYLEKNAPGAEVEAADARLISFRSGYRKTPWRRNVVAVGMSAGFVEPLEASAIVMIELMATMISDTLPPVRAQMDIAAKRFNERFSYRWERIVDFLKLHYVLSRRTEPYWQDHRDPESWPPRLSELLERWRYEAPSREDFVQNREIFPAASYAYVLYGMGFETCAPQRTRRQARAEALQPQLAAAARTTERFLARLPSNRELLRHIQSNGLGRV